MPRIRVSVIATVRNETQSLDEWLMGLERQLRRPDEVVIVDGGSDDGTWERLQRWQPSFPVALLSAPSASISEGRNLAIAASHGDVIAVTDAGTVADPEWLEHLTSALDDCSVDVASGFFRPVLGNMWNRALAAATLPDAEDIRGDQFQPSSRSLAFWREWWESGVAYPEWLDYCEDLVWDLSMRRAGARFKFVPEAVVAFRPRPDVKSYALQYFRYARGDGKAGLFAERHAVRYASYALLFSVLSRRRPLEVVATGILAMLYVRKPLRRLMRRDASCGADTRDTVLAAPMVVALRVVGDVAKMVGYPAGLAWRLTQFGSLGWRTTWGRISPDGQLFRPATMSKGTPPPSSSRGA